VDRRNEDDQASGLVGPGQRRLSRRALLGRVGAAATLAAASQVPFARWTEAGVRWCQIDPLIQVGDKTARLYVASAEEMLARAVAPVTVLFMIPAGLNYALLDSDAGFGYGYNVSFAVNAGMRTGQSIPVQVGLVCPSWDSSLPVRVDWVPADASAGSRTVDGRANSWISFDARM
jgi:hypothetical protein